MKILLYFGGLVPTENKVFSTVNPISCEDIELENSIISNPTTFRDYILSTCGNLLVNEMWSFSLESRIFSLVNQGSYLTKGPSSRYGHASTYVEYTDSKYNLKRKFMYVYGGFSGSCSTVLSICSDMWSYEIPYAPKNLYPSDLSNIFSQTSGWVLIGNFTESLGPLAKHKMIFDNFGSIFFYGGVSFNKTLNSTYYSSKVFKYNVLTQQISEVETQGIVSVERVINFWDGTQANVKLSPYNLKLGDVVKYGKYVNSSSDDAFPKARADASITFNDDCYYLYGGYYWNKTNSKKVILGDFWKFSLRDYTWTQIYNQKKKLLPSTD